MLLSVDCFKMSVIIGCYESRCIPTLHCQKQDFGTEFYWLWINTLAVVVGLLNSMPPWQKSLYASSPFPLNLEALLAHPCLIPLLTQTTFPGREMPMVAVSGVSLDPQVCFPQSFRWTFRNDFHLELILDGWLDPACWGWQGLLVGETKSGCNLCYIIDVYNNSSLRKSESRTTETSLVDPRRHLVIDALRQLICWGENPWAAIFLSWDFHSFMVHHGWLSSRREMLNLFATGNIHSSAVLGIWWAI